MICFCYFSRQTEKKILGNQIGHSHTFVMNRCEIRLYDDTNSETFKKKSYYFLIKNMNFISDIYL